MEQKIRSGLSVFDDTHTQYWLACGHEVFVPKHSMAAHKAYSTGVVFCPACANIQQKEKEKHRLVTSERRVIRVDIIFVSINPKVEDLAVKFDCGHNLKCRLTEQTTTEYGIGKLVRCLNCALEVERIKKEKEQEQEQEKNNPIPIKRRIRKIELMYGDYTKVIITLENCGHTVMDNLFPERNKLGDTIQCVICSKLGKELNGTSS